MVEMMPIVLTNVSTSPASESRCKTLEINSDLGANAKMNEMRAVDVCCFFFMTYYMTLLTRISAHRKPKITTTRLVSSTMIAPEMGKTSLT
jgi:hypothetical protein